MKAMVNFEKGKFYFLRVLVIGRELEYNCKILEVGEGKLMIASEEGDCLDFDLKDIVYSKEIDSFEREAKIVVRKKRVPWWKLKIENGPEVN